MNIQNHKIIKQTSSNTENTLSYQKHASNYFKIYKTNILKNQNITENSNTSEMHNFSIENGNQINKFQKLNIPMLDPNYKKEVTDWLFSLPITERVQIATVENFWVARAVHQMYQYYKEDLDMVFKFKDENDDNTIVIPTFAISKSNVEKSFYDIWHNDDPFESNIMAGFKYRSNKSNNKSEPKSLFSLYALLVKEIVCYSIHNNLDSISLPEKILKEENLFNYYFEHIAGPDRAFEAPIRPFQDSTSKAYNYILPDWINPKNYYNIVHLFMAFIEQTISIKFLLNKYKTQKPLIVSLVDSDKILQIYEKKREVTDYLKTISKEELLKTLEIDDLITQIYNDEDISNVIKSKNRQTENRFKSFTAKNIVHSGFVFEMDRLQDTIKKAKEKIEQIKDYEKFVNDLIYMHISSIWRYDYFIGKKIFEKIHALYTEKNANDLLLDTVSSINPNTKKNKKKNKKPNLINIPETNQDVSKINSKEHLEDINRIDINTNKTDEHKDNEAENIILELASKADDAIKTESDRKDIENHDKALNGKAKRKKEHVFHLYENKKTEKTNKSNTNDINKPKVITFNNLSSPKNIDSYINSNDHNISTELTKSNSDSFAQNKVKLSSLISEHENGLIKSPQEKIKHQKTDLLNKITTGQFILTDKVTNSKNNTDTNNYKLNKFNNKPNKLDNFYIKLERDIVNYHHNVQNTLKQLYNTRLFVVNYVKELANQYSNNKIILDIYGSFASDLAIESSDIDIKLSIKEGEDLTGDRLLNILETNFIETGLFETVHSIGTASVPIIKLTVDPNKILDGDNLEDFKRFQTSKEFNEYQFKKEELLTVKIDLTLVTTVDKIDLGTNSVLYARNALMQFPEIRPILQVLKRFLQSKRLNTVFNGKIIAN